MNLKLIGIEGIGIHLNLAMSDVMQYESRYQVPVLGIVSSTCILISFDHKPLLTMTLAGNQEDVLLGFESTLHWTILVDKGRQGKLDHHGCVGSSTEVVSAIPQYIRGNQILFVDSHV